ncbi:polysaccharide biosynthesis protein [Lewinella cohaerens]|uniref:polysaccharide biosynthesis protein n=1 Tax=Lewinella cohaerens TaxID=70995 RepID=UPI0003790E9A|nr:nucleoside-diphosphate sugar epimerase/dehydratase [Lewinella cohaerens]
MKFNSQKSILGANPIAGYVTKLFIFGVDMVYALIAITIALLLTGDFEFERLNLLLTWGPVLLLAFRAISFIVFRTYLLIVRYVGEKDYKSVFYAASLSSAIFFLLLKFLATPFKPKEVLPIVLVDYFVLLLLAGGSRIVLRLLFDRLRLQGANRLNTAIFGAGELGAMLHNVLKQNTTHNYRVTAFFDDNPRVHKKYLNGVRIFNPEKSFAAVVKKYNIKYAIIGINGLPETRRVAFINECLEHQVKVMKVPPTENWLNSKLDLGQLRKIRFEDLLSRPAIELDQKGIRESIQGKVVLVTGCAGSIGSEIVRQLLPYEPGLLIGVDQAETPLAQLELSLKTAVKNKRFLPVIGDVRNKGMLEQLFGKYQPEYVFHAAAYKHVPIMEHFPAEAIRTNVMGTMNLADLAVKHQVQKFVMVSTDKAVNPSNVMGASKRIAEIYVQALSSRGDHHTQFITTRFGNVLGSNGSVIPIFKKQIEHGQAVTVTHPEVTRFFMTIPEACQLVLEAGAMGKGSEIFIFDMGEPVKIIDLAHKMIQMAGLVPGEDIEIRFTGLRPGEKLYEELLDDGEGVIATHHPKIQKAAVRANDYHEIETEMAALVKLMDQNDVLLLVGKMKDIVPEFSSLNSKFSVLDNSEIS